MAAVKNIAGPAAPELDPERQLTLDEVVGHREAREFLRGRVRQGRLPQSLLITGPPGVGKHTLAWALAREIVAEGEDPATHRGSGKVARGTHPDILLLAGSGAGGQITIETIHDMEEKVARSPLEANQKIAIISGAERMNPNAANSLLKLLEEPPGHLQLILITADPSALLDTIRSRCAIVPLESTPLDDLIPWLKKKTGKAEERARLAAEIAEGRPGLALEMLASGGLELRKILLEQLGALKTHGFAAVFGVAERLAGAETGGSITALGMTLMLLRDALALALGAGEVLNRDLEPELRAWSEGIDPDGILEAATLVETAAGMTGNLYSANARLHFYELLMIRVGRAIKGR